MGGWGGHAPPHVADGEKSWFRWRFWWWRMEEASGCSNLREIMWYFVHIVIFCNKLRCQLLSGWQKTKVLCTDRIEVILMGNTKMSGIFCVVVAQKLPFMPIA
jgi:hypothetical protein